MKLPPLLSFKEAPQFTTDGCSGFMTWAWLTLLGKEPPWNGGCVIHDWYYWSGGSPINGRAAYRIKQLGGDRVRRTSPLHFTVVNRREADQFLFDYIQRRGYPVWAWLCWLSVRVGGSQYLPFSWRWRYRHSYWDVIKER